jgi:hypothetical protein
MKLKKNVNWLIRDSDKLFHWNSVVRLTSRSVRSSVTTITLVSVRSRISVLVRNLICNNLQKNFKKKEE